MQISIHQPGLPKGMVENNEGVDGNNRMAISAPRQSRLRANRGHMHIIGYVSYHPDQDRSRTLASGWPTGQSPLERATQSSRRRSRQRPSCRGAHAALCGFISRVTAVIMEGRKEGGGGRGEGGLKRERERERRGGGGGGGEVVVGRASVVCLLSLGFVVEPNWSIAWLNVAVSSL